MSVVAFHAIRPALVGLAIASGLALGAPQASAAYQLQLVNTFNEPIDLRSAPGFPNLRFVAEKPGRIIVLLQNDGKAATPFLDIQDIVSDGGGEEGLLSLAFPPNYQTSRLFYVLFVNNAGNIEIGEFKRSATDPKRAIKSSRRTVLVVQHPGAGNHNGGQLHFDSAGRLYIAIGDGGNPGLPGLQDGEPARQLDRLLGKILRIYPAKNATKPYTIPAANPFVGKTGRDEIFAYGLRNPYRMSLEGGRIFIADVGQGTQEEVNARTITGATGVNFGWPEWEGTFHYRPTSPGPGPHKPPIFTYANDSSTCAIVGGYVVGDPGLPALAGRYLYGDYCTGGLRSFILNLSTQTATGDRSLRVNLPPFSLYSFARDAARQIYVLGDGKVQRLEQTP